MTAAPTPRSKRRSTPRLAALRRLLRGALVLAIAAGVLAWDLDRQLDQPLALQRAATFEIVPGSGLNRIVTAAREQGLFASARQSAYLAIYARFSGQASRIKAGEYRLEPGLTPRTLLMLWDSGKTVLHELRLIEGWRFADALKTVRQSPDLTQTLDAAATPADAMRALGRDGQAPEGLLFPDTYRFQKGMTDVAFLRNAIAEQERVLGEEWAKRAPNLPYDSPQQALTMASIIEKETGTAAERAEIAGVFVRRLRLGMRLQTDPTVIYGIGEAYDGNIRSRDLLADTPYNTYTRDGLPPTPICLAGREAIRAALQPADGNALYFVARGDGSHQFSATLDEHNAAVQRFQLRSGRSSTAAPAASGTRPGAAARRLR